MEDATNNNSPPTGANATNNTTPDSQSLAPSTQPTERPLSPSSLPLIQFQSQASVSSHATTFSAPTAPTNIHVRTDRGHFGGGNRYTHPGRGRGRHWACNQGGRHQQPRERSISTSFSSGSNNKKGVSLPPAKANLANLSNLNNKERRRTTATTKKKNLQVHPPTVRQKPSSKRLNI